jgi:HAD superfamily hydrolase (TIGR01509 family)
MSAPREIAGTPRGVIFDMDGVLVDSGAHHRAAWRALLRELAVEEPPEAWRSTIGRPSEEAVSLLLGRELPPGEARRLARRKHEHYARAAHAGLPVVPGAAGFVRRLADLGVPRAVGTSARRVDADRLLGAAGLLPLFAAIVTAEDVAAGKPDPEVYLKAAHGIGIPPAQCLVFEDSVVGIEAARRAGMRVVGLTTAHHAMELLAAGAAHAIADFEGCPWPM